MREGDSAELLKQPRGSDGLAHALLVFEDEPQRAAGVTRMPDEVEDVVKQSNSSGAQASDTMSGGLNA